MGDFNGDGKPDLFVNEGILLNTGKGRFPSVANYQFPDSGEFVLADFNRDGRTDVVAVGFHSDFAEFAMAGPGGTLGLPRTYFVNGEDAVSVTTGDFNGDGHVDLAVACNTLGIIHKAGVLNVLPGRGDGTFRTTRSSTNGPHSAFFVTAADLNHDSKLDLVFGGSDAISIRLGVGDGSFQEAISYPAYRVTEIAVADFNGDGIPDLAASSDSGPGQILLGNGDGTFRAGADVSAEIGSLVAADFNHDGKEDVAISLRSGGVGIMLGNGNGTFQPLSLLRKGQGGSLVVADFNGDGNLDVAGVGTTLLGNAVASVYLGNGDGTLQTSKNIWIHAGVAPGGVATADFDGDGKADLAVTLRSGIVAVLRGDGTGRFNPPSFHPGLGPGIPIVADFDGNGTPDLAFPSGNAVTVLLNQP